MKEGRFEFYGTPEGEVMISDSTCHRVYEQSDREFTKYMLDKIQNFHTEAHKALCEVYSRSALNRSYYEYLIVRRFIKCNFFEFDPVPDMDENGSFKFEFVPCPLRGECKYTNVICNAKFNTQLTAMENKVMKFYFNGKRAEEIADELFISIHTVKTHKRNALQRLNFSNLNDFVVYARKNRLYEYDND